MTTSATDQNSVYIFPGNPEKETYRLSTYLKFPAIVPVDVVVLARHGFYYTGHKDRVKCFSCGTFIQDWCPQDNPRLARWHLRGCKLVLGTETSNVTIGIHKPEFVGTFISLMSTSGTGYPSSATSSSENPLPLFPSYPTRSPLLNSSHVPPLSSRGEVRNGEIALLNRSSPELSTLPPRLNDIHISQSNPLDYTFHTTSNAVYQTAHIVGSNQSVPSKVKIQGLDLASVITSSHRILLVQTLDLHKEEDRLKSFAIWKCNAVRPEDLAKSGFFYLGNLDRCQCFSCSGVLRNWRYGDCVNDEHRRHFGDCKMVLEREHRNVTLNGVTLTLTEPADPSPEEELQLGREFPCLHPVNPHMRDYEARLQTFDKRWPSYKVLATKEHIAKAGFFFLGERDRAKCWYCNGGLQNWDPNDEPFTEHAKWFPGCEYMLRCKGVDFVRNIVQQFPNLQRPTLRRPRFDHRTRQLIDCSPAPPTQVLIHDTRATKRAGALLQNYNPSTPEASTPMITESPSLTNGGESSTEINLSDLEKQAEELGIAKERIHQGIHLIRDGEREFRDANEFFNFLTEQQPTQSAPPSIQHEVLEQSSACEEKHAAFASTKRSHGMEVNETGLPKDGKSEETLLDISKPDSNEVLSKELEELENERKCKNCFKRQADTVIIPCGHLALCSECSPAAKKCGVCRTKIVNCIKVFLS